MAGRLSFWFWGRGAFARGAGGGRCPSCGKRGSFAPPPEVGDVLSLSRERTKGRPGAAKLCMRDGCPRTPSRLAGGSNLLSREAKTFLAGAAWNGFVCLAGWSLAAGRHRWAALVARRAALRAGTHGLTGQTRCGAASPPHGRRSKSNLRRPPQEVAASLNHGGGRKPGRSGATVGEPRPSSRMKRGEAPFPSGEGVTAQP